jgi:Zn-dependent peptidase ImmA (M78 family)
VQNLFLTPEQLLKKVGLYRIPVPVFSVAEALGAEVYFFQDDDLAGKLEASVDDSSAKIEVSWDHPETRQRFTVAHEIGHLILHADRAEPAEGGVYTRKDYDLDSKNPIEEQANGYAAKLLMPRPKVRGLVQEWGLDLKRLAKAFNVSPTAMRNQLNNMGMVD